MDQWTVKRILSWIEDYLSKHGDTHPRLSAQWLVSDVLDCSRLELYTDLERPLSEEERATLREYTVRRAEGEPLQYITKTCDFRFISLSLEQGVLIPRPETEVLVSEALAVIKDQIAASTEQGSAIHVLDLCTGSGNIACSLASEVPCIDVIATDISSQACALAQVNSQKLGLQDRICVIQGDLASNVPQEFSGGFSLVISNPPYIPSNLLGSLDSEVKDFEPLLALDGGTDGLDIFRRIAQYAYIALVPQGVLAVELHETCLDAAKQYAHDVGFRTARIVNDLASRPRVLIAEK